MIRFKRLLCSALVALGVVAPAAAETYPARPVTMIVAYPPGGASDVIARVVAAKMSERLGQQVVVENRAGAGGNLGAKQAAQVFCSVACSGMPQVAQPHSPRKSIFFQQSGQKL